MRFTNKDLSNLLETAELRVSEAVGLAHALLSRLAELEGIRILFVKGPTAIALGARPPRPSSDVDLLCEPGGMERLGVALEACGWRPRLKESSTHRLEHAAEYLFEHSVHYIHHSWPCDLDIHYNIPGFFAPEAVVFEALWARRASATVASMPAPCADRFGQTAIVGLHALRDPGVAHSDADLDFLTRALCQLEPAVLSQFSTFAAETGCVDALSPLLERVGAAVPPSPWSNSEKLRRWRVRTESAGSFTTHWLIELGDTSWPRKPVLLWRALFLPREELLSRHVGVEPAAHTLLRLQASRWWRAARHVRKSIRAARERGRRVP